MAARTRVRFLTVLQLFWTESVQLVAMESLRYFGFCLIIASAQATCANFSAAGYQVTSDSNSGNCNGNGGEWVLGCCIACGPNKFATGLIVSGNTIFSSIENAFLSNISSTLQFLPGVYRGPAYCGVSISNDLVQLLGVCGPALTTIDCGQSSPHFMVRGQNFTIQGLTLRNGQSAGSGGCISILSPGAGIALIDTILSNCVSFQDGGAISVNNADQSLPSQSVSISITGQSRIENCSARQHGGALYMSIASR